MKNRRVTLMVETERLPSITRKPRSEYQHWCALCGERVKFITPDEAAYVAGVSVRAIYSQAEAGRLHFIETNEGVLRVCLNSISKQG